MGITVSSRRFCTWQRHTLSPPRLPSSSRGAKLFTFHIVTFVFEPQETKVRPRRWLSPNAPRLPLFAILFALSYIANILGTVSSHKVQVGAFLTSPGTGVRVVVRISNNMDLYYAPAQSFPTCLFASCNVTNLKDLVVMFYLAKEKVWTTLRQSNTHMYIDRTLVRSRCFFFFFTILHTRI